jgi:hypothetical protein
MYTTRRRAFFIDPHIYPLLHFSECVATSKTGVGTTVVRQWSLHLFC